MNKMTAGIFGIVESDLENKLRDTLEASFTTVTPENLTTIERDFLVNGCGPGKFGTFVDKFFPKWVSFEACGDHDIGYGIGCTKEDRKIEDCTFLKKMNREIVQNIKNDVKEKWKGLKGSVLEAWNKNHVIKIPGIVKSVFSTPATLTPAIRVLRFGQARIYYQLVRLCGEKSFHKADHKLTKNELHTQMRAKGIDI